jgi:hypothetical protein
MDFLIEDPPVPGRHVTDHQMRLYMKFRQIDSPSVAAAKASISSARNVSMTLGQPMSRFRLG